MILYPLLCKPLYKDYLWGGEQIIQTFHRKEVPGKYAESWEIADRFDGMSVVENGPLKGKTLHDLMMTEKEALLGEDCHFTQFPLLIKIIDAKQDLSVQVHPDDCTAQSFGGEVKNEAWIVLDAKKDAKAYAGFRQLFPKKQILKYLFSKKILSFMHTRFIQKHDVVFIPGGRIHAIGSGSLIFEVQQNSNTTYRIYDFGRGRSLHHKEAKRAIHFDDIDHPFIAPIDMEHTSNYTRIQLIRTPFFIIEQWQIYHPIRWPKYNNKVEILFFFQGQIFNFPLGRTLLLPAQSSPLDINTDGVTLFRIYLP